MHKTLIAISFAIGLSVPALAQDDWRSQAVDALPPIGEMHLQFLVNDQPDGFMRMGWIKDEEAGVLVFYDRTMFASQEIYETLGGSMDLATLTPIDIAIRFHQQSAILSVEGAVENGVMRGGRAIVTPGQPQQAEGMEVPLTDGMIMRGAVFFLAQSLPLDIGESISFDWFAPLAGSASTVTITAAEGGEITTIAGTFETIRLEIRGGSPDNDIYVTSNDGLRQIVRIDVVGQPMRFEAYDITR